MRVTVDPNDADFIGVQNLGRFKVLFNGVALDDCVEADDAQGYAVVYLRDDNGHVLVDRQRQAAVRQRVNGRIEIVDTRS